MTNEPTILLVNGPNLNRLGQREPGIYGSDSLADVVGRVQHLVETDGFTLLSMQSNHEGEILDFLQQHAPLAVGVILNPGAFAHSSYALRDCLADVASACPVIEVHISNVYRREPFRHQSVLAPVVTGQITGLGTTGYDLAAEYLLRILTGS